MLEVGSQPSWTKEKRKVDQSAKHGGAWSSIITKDSFMLHWSSLVSFPGFILCLTKIAIIENLLERLVTQFDVRIMVDHAFESELYSLKLFQYSLSML